MYDFEHTPRQMYVCGWPHPSSFIPDQAHMFSYISV